MIQLATMNFTKDSLILGIHLLLPSAAIWLASPIVIGAAEVATNATFTKITTGSIVSDQGTTFSGAWGDYDNDGYLDLVAANGGPSLSENEFLYHNEGTGTFAKILGMNIVTNGGYSFAAAWGDYDNDGRLDLFIPNLNQKNFLYQNAGNGSFNRITNGSIVNDIGNSVACGWADYDNDGYLDLFVANRNVQKNFVYHNNGDGTFTRIFSIILTAAGNSEGCAWGDYDNDGFMDLFVAN